MQRGARSLARLTGTRIVAAGANCIAQLPALLWGANHASYLDGFAMAAALPGRYTFVAARSSRARR